MWADSLLLTVLTVLIYRVSVRSDAIALCLLPSLALTHSYFLICFQMPGYWQLPGAENPLDEEVVDVTGCL